MKFEKNRIISLRENLGLNHVEFARKLKTTRQKVWNWEAGDCKPSVASLEEMTEVFDVPIGYFFVDNLACEQTKKQVA